MNGIGEIVHAIPFMREDSNIHYSLIKTFPAFTRMLKAGSRLCNCTGTIPLTTPRLKKGQLLHPKRPVPQRVQGTDAVGGDEKVGQD